MGSDFYTDDYAYGGGGGYYDGGGGGGIDYGFDTTSWPTFDQYYSSGGLPPDYGPDLGGDLDTGLWQGDGGQYTQFDVFNDYLDYYIGLGYDALTAADLAAQDASAGSIEMTTIEQGPLPEASLPTIPLNSFYDYWQSPPWAPEYPEFPLPPPPTDQPRLPGYCPGGTYHPVGDPYSCVPFPEATTNQQQQQRPPQQQQPAPSASRPPAQQQQPQQACQTGYCKHPTTGQCIPIPAGYMRHPQTQVCTRQTAQASPLPPTETQDLWANLKSLPWWVWLAGAGLIFLSRGEERTTTVRYRRAS